MRVIKDREIVEDGWLLLAPDADVPERGDVIVSLARWNVGHESLLARPGKTGLLLQSDQEPEQIQALEQLSLIAIEFPRFTDGRGYTSARLLRERFQFRGELRAVGDVLRDQLFYMARCGINSFALKAGKDVEGALEAFRDFSITYQAAADDPRPLFRRLQR
jgi:uncharacterized protein (DUF934 family)